MKSIKYILISLLVSGFLSTSCNKMLEFEPDPDESTLLTDALRTPEDMQKLLISCYDVMTNGYYGRQQNLAELLGDNLNAPYNNDDYTEVYNRNTIFFNGTISNFFQEPYIAIYRANVLLENFDLIEGLEDSDRIRIEAEARFIRAANHFEMVNLFAQPYMPGSSNDHLGIVLKRNSSFDPLPRATVGEVYNFILEDLNFAKNNLPESNDVFANKYAAYAMLARVYFQMNDFENAANAAAVVTNSGAYSLGTEYDRWSSSVSSENIFTLIVFESDGRSNGFGSHRSDQTDLPTLTAPVSYYNELYGDIPPGTPTDLRKDWFEYRQIGTADPFYASTKFNADFFNLPYLHLSEILLIEAESLAESNGDLSKAINNINLLRQKANIGLLNSGSTSDAVINAARTERRKEMYGEGRWVMDQKRRGALGDLDLVRGVPYDCNGMVLQFPISENTSNFIMNPSGGCN